MADEIEGGQEAQADDLATALGEAFDAQGNDEGTETDLTPGVAAEGDGADAVAEPPEHWSQEDKDTFAALPEGNRTWFLGKVKAVEAGFDGKFKEVAEQRKRFADFEPVMQELEPCREQLRVAGVSPSQYLSQLMAIDRFVRQSPVEAIKHIAQQRGIDLQQLSGETAEDDVLDSRAADKFRSLEKQVQDLTGRFSQTQQANNSARVAELQQTIDAFEQAKDDKGESLHPHFEAVKSRMSALIGSGAAVDLDGAYDQAVWADPAIRATLVDRTAAKNAAAAAEKRKQEVEKARLASKNVKGDPGKAATDPAPSVKEELMRQFDAATA